MENENEKFEKKENQTNKAIGNNIDYYSRIIRLGKETLTLKRISQINSGFLRFLVILFQVPFYLMFLGFYIILLFLAIDSRLFIIPIRKLHTLLHDEGQSVKHATQFVVYFLSWNLIFILYFFYFVFFILIDLLYISTSFLGYVLSLGSFKFHIFASEEDISKEYKHEVPLSVSLSHVLIDLFLGVFDLIFLIISLAAKNSQVGIASVVVNIICIVAYVLTAIIYAFGPYTIDVEYRGYNRDQDIRRKRRPTRRR